MTTWQAVRLFALVTAVQLPFAPPLAAQGSLDARLAAADTLSVSDPAQALARLDAMLAEPAIKADLRITLEVQTAQCWILASTQAPKTIALVDALATPANAARAPDAIAMLRLCQGFAHEREGKLALAMAAYEAGVETGTRLRNDRVLGKASVLRGEQRAVQGRYGDAIEDLKSAHDLATRRGDEAGVDYALNALANLYGDRNVKDYTNAMATYARLLASHERRGNVQGQATAHFNVASTLESQGDLKGALASFKKAMELDSNRGARSDTAFDERAMGIVLSKLGRHAEALALIDKSLVHYESIKDEDGIGMMRLTRGTAHRRAARYELAVPDLEAAKSYYAGRDNPRFLEKAYEELALVAAAAKRWDRAFELRGEQMALQQKLQQGLLDERLGRLRVQFQTEQAVLQAQLLASENEKARRALVAERAATKWQYTALGLSVAAIAILLFSVLLQMRHGRRMRDLALTDELTRLPNRRHFMTVATTVFEHARKAGTGASLIALDIDHFKRANDTFGHAVGDQLLQRAAHAMRCALRPGDTIGRVGGEEFLVVLPGAAAGEAANAAERMRQAVAAVDCSDLGAGLSLRVSLGVAEMGKDEKLDSTIRRADAALYAAKNQGRDRVVVS